MQTSEKIVIVVVAGITVLAVKQMRDVQREERAKRAKIKADAAEEIIAINRAAAVVQDRLRNGHYDGKLTIGNVMTDFAFEQIVQHEK